MWAKVWAFLTGIFGWMWNNKQVASYIILAIIIVFLTWRNNALTIKNSIMAEERSKLPDNISFVAVVKDTDFKITYRDSQNNTVVKDVYVPREGSVTFTKYIDLKNYDAKAGFKSQSTQPQITNPIADAIAHLPIIGHILEPNLSKPQPGSDVISVAAYGLTFHPGISAVYSGGLTNGQPFLLGADAKLLYCYRWSAGAGSTSAYPYLFISRHIDDLIPFIKVENLEIMAEYGKPYSNFSGSEVGAGARTNF